MAMFGERSARERELLAGARARLEPLALYRRPLRMARVRIVHAPWFFRLPVLRRFVGFEFAHLILVKAPLDEVGEDLIVHELTHVWQHQNRPVWQVVSYLVLGYADNPHEVEARAAVERTRA
jgi:hypothetical protein